MNGALPKPGEGRLRAAEPWGRGLGQGRILGHQGRGDTRSGLEPGALDLTLLGEPTKKGGGQVLAGWADLAPAHPPPCTRPGRRRELRAGVSFCSF